MAQIASLKDVYKDFKFFSIRHLLHTNIPIHILDLVLNPND